MPIEPLFVATYDKLKAQLRLAASASDTIEVIERATKTARIDLYAALGTSRIDTLRAITEVDNPTTQDQISRGRASLLEIAMVRKYLLLNLPSVFQDGTSATQQRWNEDGLIRSTTTSQLEAQLAACDIEINQHLEALRSGEEEKDNVRASVIGPATRNTQPGTSSYPYGIYLT